MTSDKKPVQDFVALCEAAGLQHVVITPGSRNAPFSISFWKHPSFKTYSIVDERSAAFFALGIAQQTGKPTVLICTSGTAALNFAPAIAEAYYQQVPLLVVTADRPLESIDQGEGQTIRQSGVFRNIVKADYDIVQEATDPELARHNVRIISAAIQITTSASPGPVHINFPLRESLYKTHLGYDAVEPVKIASTKVSLEENELKYFREKLEHAGKVLVLTGQLSPRSALSQSLKNFAKHPAVAVITETHSNLHDEQYIGTTDRLIMGFGTAEKKLLHPDILITIGENIISRKIKAILRESGMIHWHIDECGKLLDTFLKLDRVVPMKAEDFLDVVSNFPATNSDSSYKAELLKRNIRNRESAKTFVDHAPFSDLAVMQHILSALPGNSELQMGNSSVVRYVQLFDSTPGLIYRGNRGVSGIDGCTSTAIGAAFTSQKKTTLITGELAFFYDSNAFWNQYVPAHLKIVVINNGGGGIFRIIEGPSTSDALEDFFETKHDRRCSGLAAMYDLPYRCVENMEGVRDGMEWLNASDRCSVLEIVTPRLENDVVLKNFFRHIAENQIDK